MKRGICLLLLCLSCLVICGCKNDQKNSEPGNGTTVSVNTTVSVSDTGYESVDIPQVRGEGVVFYRGGTYTEEYTIYDGDPGLKRIFNVESHQTMPYCFDPGCEHRHEKRSLDGTEVLEEGCPAYDYTEQSVFIHEEHLYFFDDGCLYQADPEGRNRKILCRLSKPYTTIQGDCYYTDEAMYVPYILYYDLILYTENGKEEWLPGEKKEKQEAGVLRIPFSGEGESVIFRSNEYYDMQVVSLWRHDGCICFQVIGRDCPFSVIQEEAGDDWQATMNVDLQHSFTEAYDYVIETGEIRSFAYEKPSHGGFYFFRDVYGVIQDSGRLELHRYSGELTAETEVPFSGVISDQYLIGYNMENNKGVLLNQENGKVVKTSPFTWEDFILEVVVGDSCYGVVTASDGKLKRAYLSANDYWAGNKNGIVVFSE